MGGATELCRPSLFKAIPVFRSWQRAGVPARSL